MLNRFALATKLCGRQGLACIL